jgi:hypothetical protein
MSEIPLILNNPPALSDEAASRHLLDLFYELTAALENHYALQLRRYHGDLFEDFNDDLPVF